MKRRSKTLAVCSVALFVSGMMIAPSVAAYETEECGPMCHHADSWANSHGKTAPYVGGKQGSFADMKRHFRIGPKQEKAWDSFQAAVFNRMLAAFDTETLTHNNLSTTPTDFNTATLEPSMSVKELANWDRVLKAYREMTLVLQQDQKQIAQRINLICKELNQ
ncbi:MAG: hypothetical protein HQL54_02055 [Magnetococcales bacterium]|nr:hypothetical protein [Magnetococcales bacterium]